MFSITEMIKYAAEFFINAIFIYPTKVFMHTPEWIKWIVYIMFLIISIMGFIFIWKYREAYLYYKSK